LDLPFLAYADFATQEISEISQVMHLGGGKGTKFRLESARAALAPP
jgi:hypothetical protein